MCWENGAREYHQKAEDLVDIVSKDYVYIKGLMGCQRMLTLKSRPE